MKTKKFYKVYFEDGKTTSFYINNLGLNYYAELKLEGWDILNQEKYTLGTLNFEGNSFEEILEMIVSFITENAKSGFTYKEE